MIPDVARLLETAGLPTLVAAAFGGWKQLAAPFGENHLFLAAIPVLAGFVTLFLR